MWTKKVEKIVFNSDIKCVMHFAFDAFKKLNHSSAKEWILLLWSLYGRHKFWSSATAPENVVAVGGLVQQCPYMYVVPNLFLFFGMIILSMDREQFHRAGFHSSVFAFNKWWLICMLQQTKSCKQIKKPYEKKTLVRWNKVMVKA